MREKMARQLAIKLTSPPHGRATFEALADLFARHRGDRRVILELELRGPATNDHPLRVRAGLAAQVRVQPSDQLASEVERICGPGLWCCDNVAVLNHRGHRGKTKRKRHIENHVVVKDFQHAD